MTEHESVAAIGKRVVPDGVEQAAAVVNRGVGAQSSCWMTSENDDQVHEQQQRLLKHNVTTTATTTITSRIIWLWCVAVSKVPTGGSEANTAGRLSAMHEVVLAL